MEDTRSSASVGFRTAVIAASAVGALAVGAFAIGVLAIRRLVVRSIVVDGAEFKSVRIHDLTVTRLQVDDLTVRNSLKLTGREADGNSLPEARRNP
jgi:hypothetical protein